jgi:site-specific recombinase XerD
VIHQHISHNAQSPVRVVEQATRHGVSWINRYLDREYVRRLANDMIRAGMSLPALMQLMGHADIQTTLLYVQVTPQDVYLEYARAVAQHIRPLPKAAS